MGTIWRYLEDEITFIMDGLLLEMSFDKSISE